VYQASITIEPEHIQNSATSDKNKVHHIQKWQNSEYIAMVRNCLEYSLHFQILSILDVIPEQKPEIKINKEISHTILGADLRKLPWVLCRFVK
jgi:hypothetical protein